MWWFMILRKAVWLFFEAKYSKTLETMDTDCQKALDQINEKMYAKEYEDDFDHILCYGVSFFKKRCCIKLKRC